MRPTLPLAMLLATLSAGTAAADSPASAGTLVIIGGALRFDNADVWKRIVRHAAEAKAVPISTSEGEGDYRPRIAVFPTASSDPEYSGRAAAEILQNYGADAFVVPVASRLTTDPRQAVHDARLVAQVREADGVYFTGGSQARIVDFLRAEDGSSTPLLDAVWEVYRKGGVVAGTSAGAAVMSSVMYRDAKNVLPTLMQGVTMGREVDRGLGFLDPAWFVEQHTLVRGRFARALVAMQANGIKYGVGVDENTAVVVKDDAMEVVGYKGAIVMDLSESKADPSLKAFNVQNVKLTYLDQGDALCLSTCGVLPSAKKQAGTKLDPKSPDFEPESSEPIFSSDVLGNTTAIDLMWKLMTSLQDEAVGLAFDGQAALAGPATGFEFRFYRGDDTVGWCCYSRGDESYTVANMRLDVRPIEVRWQLGR